MRSADYSDNGDIIIHMQQETTKKVERIGDFNWSITEQSYSADLTPVAQPKAHKTSKHSVAKVALTPLKECAQEVHSVKEGLQTYNKSLLQDLRRCFAYCKKRLTQPVYISKSRKKVTKTNRLFLFFSDSFRFGLTFSAIFGILFVSLNYESFWAIASDQLNPVATLQKQQEISTKIDSVLSSNTVQSNTMYGNSSLLAHLPAVGPEKNQLIIPKLGLTAPITTPEYEALLREDWTQLEKDIQAALEDGVVHYPGTAEAGQPGNFFITGHSSYYSWAPGDFKSIFAKLHLLNVGDEYYVYYKGDKHKYIITEKKEVQPSNVHVLDQPLDKRMSTLMTCTPVGTTLRRLILSAQEVDPVSNAIVEVGEQQKATATQPKPAVLPI